MMKKILLFSIFFLIGCKNQTTEPNQTTYPLNYSGWMIDVKSGDTICSSIVTIYAPELDTSWMGSGSQNFDTTFYMDSLIGKIENGNVRADFMQKNPGWVFIPSGTFDGGSFDQPFINGKDTSAIGIGNSGLDASSDRIFSINSNHYPSLKIIAR